MSDSLYKRYSKIDQHLALHFVYYVDCLSRSLIFLCSLIITPFLIQWSPSIRKIGLEFQPIVKPFYPSSCSSVEFLLFIKLLTFLSMWHLSQKTYCLLQPLVVVIVGCYHSISLFSIAPYRVIALNLRSLILTSVICLIFLLLSLMSSLFQLSQ